MNITIIVISVIIGFANALIHGAAYINANPLRYKLMSSAGLVVFMFALFLRFIIIVAITYVILKGLVYLITILN
jgi:hypothetical protein